MVGKSPVKRFGEDPEVWTASVGAEKAIPGLQSDPAQHHYGRTWRVFEGCRHDSVNIGWWERRGNRKAHAEISTLQQREYCTPL